MRPWSVCLVTDGMELNSKQSTNMSHQILRKLLGLVLWSTNILV